MRESRASSTLQTRAWAGARASWRSLDDQRLADAILEDAETLRQDGQIPGLGDYLEAIPDLRQRLVPLDAAIEAVVGSGHGREAPTVNRIESLIREYPDLELSIRDCVSLSEALCSTFELEALVTNRRPPPESVGPRLANGKHRYKLLRQIGIGSSGAVYEADDRLLSDGAVQALVAVKILDAAADERSAILWEEATKANRVKHPNVIRALDRGVSDDGHRYAVFELATGGDLVTYLADKGAITWREASDLVRQVARGIHASHQAGIIHADLKPHNILMTLDGVPKVSDFGVARRAGETSKSPASEERLGALAFMAPEQYRDSWEGATAPADTYALGGILFWLLTREYPNGATADAIDLTLSDLDQQAPWRASLLNAASVPSALRAVCLRALSPLPEHRHSSAADLAEDLSCILEHKPLPWLHRNPVVRAALWCRRRPTTSIGLAALAIAMGGGGFVAYQARAVAEVDLRQRQMSAKARDMRELFAVRGRGEYENAALTFVWILEWIGRDTTIANPELWISAAEDQRQQIVRDLVRAGVDRGQANGVETQLWRIALGLLLLTSDDLHPEVGQHLADARAVLQPILAPNDELLLQIETMQQCDLVKRAWFAAPKQGPSAVTQDPLLLDLATKLNANLIRLRKERPTSAVHRMAVRSLAHLYEPRLLDRKDLLAPLAEEKASFDSTPNSAPQPGVSTVPAATQSSSGSSGSIASGSSGSAVGITPISSALANSGE